MVNLAIVAPLDTDGSLKTALQRYLCVCVCVSVFYRVLQVQQLEIQLPDVAQCHCETKRPHQEPKEQQAAQNTPLQITQLTKSPNTHQLLLEGVAGIQNYFFFNFYQQKLVFVLCLCKPDWDWPRWRRWFTAGSGSRGESSTRGSALQGRTNAE